MLLSVKKVLFVHINFTYLHLLFQFRPEKQLGCAYSNNWKDVKLMVSLNHSIRITTYEVNSDLYDILYVRWPH